MEAKSPSILSLAGGVGNKLSCETIHDPITVREAGPEADSVVVAHWRAMWLEAGMEETQLLPDFEDRTLHFISEARRRLNYQTFVAVNADGEIIGSVSCQAWEGPIPIVVKATSFKLGSVWAVFVQPMYRRRNIATRLMEAVKHYWRRIGCLRGVLLHATQAGRAVYERIGFVAGNLLLTDLRGPRRTVNALPEATGVQIEPAGAESDDVVAKNWQLMWLETGVPESEIKPDLREITSGFLQKARASLQYQTFVARNQEGHVIGSASCQVWSGPLPLVLNEDVFKLGTVWAVYVDPEYRCQGVAKSLMEHCIAHWQSIGCQKGILLYASEGGRRIYERLGFEPANGMVIDLAKEEEMDVTSAVFPPEVCISETTASTPRTQGVPVPVDTSCNPPASEGNDMIEMSMMAALREAGISGNDRWLRALIHALPHQLEAAFGGDVSSGFQNANCELLGKVMALQREYGIYIDPSDNWFTQNLHRFGGGFDMKQLTSMPGVLAEKFDKLSSKYDHWTTGNRSRAVQDWLAKQACKHADQLAIKDVCILDVACGIGLPANQLRLCGYQGYILGTDISPGMVERSRRRGAYDSLCVDNANDGLMFVESSSMDLVICMGAMELLDHDAVLRAFQRVLKTDGQLWVSFQLEDPSLAGRQHPTAHQNVYGITSEELDQRLAAAGFAIECVERCDDAFCTPSPNKDGTLLPVPYMFVAARLP